MFHRAIHAPSLVLLRLYSWEQGAITFGINQNEDLAIKRELLDTTPLIRRVTGGRALYHEPSELTYSIAVNRAGLGNEKLSGSIGQTSEKISEALLAFLSEFGVAAQQVRYSGTDFLSRDSFHSKSCLESRARHEIVAEGRKLVASAQRQIGDAFLQHGSIKMSDTFSHPALTMPSIKSLEFNAISSLARADFEQYSSIFSEVMCEELNISFERKVLGKGTLLELRSWTDFVMKFPIIKRDPIKHLGSLNSLSR